MKNLFLLLIAICILLCSCKETQVDITTAPFIEEATTEPQETTAATTKAEPPVQPALTVAEDYEKDKKNIHKFINYSYCTYCNWTSFSSYVSQTT